MMPHGTLGIQNKGMNFETQEMSLEAHLHLEGKTKALVLQTTPQGQSN